MVTFLARSLAAGLAILLTGGLAEAVQRWGFPALQVEFQGPAFRPWPGRTAPYMLLHPFLVGPLFAAGYAWARPAVFAARKVQRRADRKVQRS